MGLPSPGTLWPRSLRRSSGEPSSLPGAGHGGFMEFMDNAGAINGGFLKKAPPWIGKPWKAPNGGRMWKDVDVGCGRLN